MSDDSLPADHPAIDPTADAGLMRYTPKVVSDHCEATKDLLKWMRSQGFACEHLEVGAKQVLIHGLVDTFAKQKLEPSRRERPVFEEDEE